MQWFVINFNIFIKPLKTEIWRQLGESERKAKVFFHACKMFM